MKRILLLTSFGLALWIEGTLATTVIAPTFERLVDDAELVFLGEVVDRRSLWVEDRDGRTIITQVTFRVDEVFKGTASLVILLEFQGGTVGDYQLQVSDIPDFAIGDRDVLFVQSRSQLPSPLVGVIHGRFRVMRNSQTGVEQLTTFAGEPFASVQELGSEEEQPTTLAATPMTLRNFRTAVQARVRAMREKRP